jgi:hypothetical protein
MVSFAHLSYGLHFRHAASTKSSTADEDQKLLLYVDYVCADMGVSIPWDAIAAKMEPRNEAAGEKPMTGEAIKQHLAKLRVHRTNEGHDVPPPLDRAARRQTAAGKNALHTPAHTPKKGGPFPSTTSARSKLAASNTQTGTPVKKESSLLAPLSKSKQKKADKAMNAALGITGRDTPAASSRVIKTLAGGTKPATGKRGRRPAVAEDEYHDDNNAPTGMATGRQLRHPERKDYSGMTLDLDHTNIKDEPESEDDMPLSKRRNTAARSGGRKKGAAGLLDDAHHLWDSRDEETAANVSAAKSPEAEHVVEPVISGPSNVSSLQEKSNQHQVCLLGTPNELSNGCNVQESSHQSQFVHSRAPIVTGLPLYHNVDYQVGGLQDRPNQEFSSDALPTSWPQIASGHPSPMDDSFAVGHQAPGHQGPGHGQHVQGGSAGYFIIPHASPMYGHQGQQIIGSELPFGSSPLHASLSSGTFPGTDLSLGFSSDSSQLASRLTSQNSSFSNTQGLENPFGGTNCNGTIGGLPICTPNTSFSDFATPSNLFTSPGDFNTGHHYPDYTTSQVSHGFADPSFTASGLGISMPPSCGDNFGCSTVASADYALPSTEVRHSHLAQPSTPIMGMNDFGLASPHDQPFGFDSFVDDMEINAGFAQLPNNDFVG